MLFPHYAMMRMKSVLSDVVPLGVLGNSFHSDKVESRLPAGVGGSGSECFLWCLE